MTPSPVRSRPLSRNKVLQNRMFLRELARSGNSYVAARLTGIARSTFFRRRTAHPAFAAEWDAALALAHARLAEATDGSTAQGRSAVPQPHLHRTRGGKIQLRSGTRRRLTRAAEQAFLAALSATANVRLSAKAAGFNSSTFYDRRRQDAGFAREMRLAIEMGYERIEAALIESSTIEAHVHDGWRHNDPPPIPAMTADQALRLLALRQKEARLIAEPDYLKRRRGESREAHSFRMGAMYRERQRRDREAFDLAEAERRNRGEPWVTGPKEVPDLPALEQVIGWSKADPAKPPAHPGRVRFGGWRLGEIPEE